MDKIDSPEMKPLFDYLDKLRVDYWNALILNRRQPQHPSFWITVHNSTYDMEQKLLRVSVQEDYARYYDFYLDK